MGDIRNAKKVVNCNRRDSKFRALLQRSTLNKSSSQWQPIIIQRRRVALLGASALLYFMASASPFCLSRCTKFYVYSFTACLAVSTSPINHVGLLALTCILPIISYHLYTRVARWLNGRASDLRSSSRGFEARPRRCCVTTLGKLFTPYCLCHQAV